MFFFSSLPTVDCKGTLTGIVGASTTTIRDRSSATAKTKDEGTWDCRLAHTLMELMYHVSVYKTCLCSHFDERDPSKWRCVWKRRCAHAHGAADLRSKEVAKQEWEAHQRLIAIAMEIANREEAANRGIYPPTDILRPSLSRQLGPGFGVGRGGSGSAGATGGGSSSSESASWRALNNIGCVSQVKDGRGQSILHTYGNCGFVHGSVSPAGLFLAGSSSRSTSRQDQTTPTPSPLENVRGGAQVGSSGPSHQLRASYTGRGGLYEHTPDYAASSTQTGISGRGTSSGVVSNGGKVIPNRSSDISPHNVQFYWSRTHDATSLTKSINVNNLGTGQLSYASTSSTVESGLTPALENLHPSTLPHTLPPPLPALPTAFKGYSIPSYPPYGNPSEMEPHLDTSTEGEAGLPLSLTSVYGSDHSFGTPNTTTSQCMPSHPSYSHSREIGSYYTSGMMTTNLHQHPSKHTTSSSPPSSHTTAPRPSPSLTSSLPTSKPTSFAFKPDASPYFPLHPLTAPRLHDQNVYNPGHSSSSDISQSSFQPSTTGPHGDLDVSLHAAHTATSTSSPTSTQPSGAKIHSQRPGPFPYSEMIISNREELTNQRTRSSTSGSGSINRGATSASPSPPSNTESVGRHEASPSLSRQYTGTSSRSHPYSLSHHLATSGDRERDVHTQSADVSTTAMKKPEIQTSPPPPTAMLTSSSSSSASTSSSSSANVPPATLQTHGILHSHSLPQMAPSSHHLYSRQYTDRRMQHPQPVLNSPPPPDRSFAPSSSTSSHFQHSLSQSELAHMQACISNLNQYISSNNINPPLNPLRSPTRFDFPQNNQQQSPPHTTVDRRSLYGTGGVSSTISNTTATYGSPFAPQPLTQPAYSNGTTSTSVSSLPMASPRSRTGTNVSSERFSNYFSDFPPLPGTHGSVSGHHIIGSLPSGPPPSSVDFGPQTTPYHLPTAPPNTPSLPAMAPSHPSTNSSTTYSSVSAIRSPPSFGGIPLHPPPSNRVQPYYVDNSVSANGQARQPSRSTSQTIQTTSSRGTGYTSNTSGGGRALSDFRLDPTSPQQNRNKPQGHQ